MTITEFFHHTPFLATVFALAYLALWGIFIYFIVQAYRK